MALRFKCRCGTLLDPAVLERETVPTCPGCGRRIHIRSGPAPSRSITGQGSPSDLGAAAGPDASTPENCTGPLEIRLPEPPSATAVNDRAAEPAASAYAPDPVIAETRLHPHTAGEAIEGPKRRFWADIGRSFALPFLSVGNAVNFAIIVIITTVGVAALYLLSVGGIAVCIIAPLVPIGVICAIYCTGWLCAFLLGVVQDSATGSDDLPDIKIEDFSVRAILRSTLRYCAAHAVVLVPAGFVWLILTLFSPYVSGLPLLPPFSAQGVASLLLPIALLLFATGPARQILRTDLVFGSIWRTFLPYLATWLIVASLQLLQVILILGAYIKCFEAELSKPGPGLFFLVMAAFLSQGFWSVFAFIILLVENLGIVQTLNLVRPLVAWIPHLGPLGMIAVIAIDLYLAVVSMHTVGLLYRHFKKRLTVVLE